ncbi:MAG: T9SS type A sorting domain-containing protein [Candidatus Latescibacteria bacterium]|nr:T9SS type A sorting domain-containing protein [Candidatus Latescibacterota bacterium]
MTKLITGRVTDPDGNPVPYAKVTLIAGQDSLTRYTKYYSSAYGNQSEESGTYTYYLPQEIITSVNESSGTEPESVILGQNTPNPFNPSTTIPYELSEAGHVSLDVYNITGQRVKVLINEYKNAGHHTVVWNGRDEDGRSAGTGVYLYNLKHNGRSLTGKMVLADGGGTHNNGRLSGNVSVQKTAVKLNGFSLIVEKDGYETHRNDNLTILPDGGALELNIVLEKSNSPEDYFHLAKGNTWTFVSFDNNSLRFRQLMETEYLLDEWSVSIIDTLTIDGAVYYEFDNFSPFFPKPVYSTVQKPLVRITEDGNLVLRDGNSDYLLYYFTQPESYQPYNEYRYVLGMYVVEHECTIKTPAGTYTDCMRVRVVNDDEYDVWFSHSAGPVYCSYEGSQSEPDTFLEKADVGSVRYGAEKGVLSGDGITDTDMKEIYRLLMDPWWFENATTFGDNFLYSNNPSGDFVFSNENINPEHIPKRTSMPFEILSPEVIQERANIFWEYWYYKIVDISAENNSITVEIEFLFKLAEDNPGGVLAGGGFKAVFTPKFGMWISKTNNTWISKTIGPTQ